MKAGFLLPVSQLANELGFERAGEAMQELSGRRAFRNFKRRKAPGNPAEARKGAF